jgi:polyisoprenoid-binding protein YceI
MTKIISREAAACAAGLFAALVTVTAGAEPVALPIDVAKSQVSFSAKQSGIPAEGKFGKFGAVINWDAAKPETSRAEVSIDLASVDMGLDDVNQELKGKEWFDTKSTPQAKFVSSSVRPLGGGKFEAAGKLTIKGHTHDVVAPFSVKAEGAGQAFEGVFAIKRLQYGVGDGEWKDTSAVADDVQIKFKIVTGAAPAAGQRK